MKTYKLKRNIYLDYVHMFIRSLNVTQGIWMIYLVTYKEFSLLDVGIFEGVFHIASLTSEVPTGMIGDLYGRKLSRLLGLGLYIIYLLIMILANSFWLILIGFIICGISYTFESGSGDALIYDTYIELNKPKEYIKFQGFKEIIFQTSSTIALFIGGYIAIKSYNLNFLIMILLFVTASIPIFYMKEISLNHEHKSSKFMAKMYEHFIKSTKIVISNPFILLLLIIGAIMAAPITTMFFYIQNYYTALEMSTGTIGMIPSVYAIAGIIGGYTARHIEQIFKIKFILIFSSGSIVILLWLITIVKLTFIPFVLLGFFDSVIYIIINYLINTFTPSEQRATVLSFSSMAFSVVMILLFPLIGLISEFSTLMTGFSVLASIVTIAFIILVFKVKNIIV